MVQPNEFVFFIRPNAFIVPHTKPILQIAPAPIMHRHGRYIVGPSKPDGFHYHTSVVRAESFVGSSATQRERMKRPPEQCSGGRPDLAEFGDAPCKLDQIGAVTFLPSFGWMSI